MGVGGGADLEAWGGGGFPGRGGGEAVLEGWIDRFENTRPIGSVRAHEPGWDGSPRRPLPWSEEPDRGRAAALVEDLPGAIQEAGRQKWNGGCFLRGIVDDDVRDIQLPEHLPVPIVRLLLVDEGRARRRPGHHRRTEVIVLVLNRQDAPRG